MATDKKDKGGRPTLYSKELEDNILAQMMGGMSLRQICKADDMPSRASVHLWVAQGVGPIDDEGTFSDRYARACEIRAHELFDEMFEIADDGTNDFTKSAEGVQLNAEHISRSRLRVDTRKWALSKLIPKTFGDKVEVDNTSSDGSMTPKVIQLVAKQAPGEDDDSTA